MLRGSEHGPQEDSGALPPGWARGLVIRDDFDQPLDDFKEYLSS